MEMMKFRFPVELGEYPDKWTSKRTMIDMPCCQATAGEDLPRGGKVVVRKIDEDGIPVAFIPTDDEAYIGVVDPFLYDEVVSKGSVFWLLVYPGLVVDARSEWTCTVLDWLIEDRPKKYLEWVADKIGVTYDALIEIAENYLYHGQYFVDRTERFRILNTFAENVDLRRFWLSVQAVRGCKLPDRLETVPIVSEYGAEFAKQRK